LRNAMISARSSPGSPPSKIVTMHGRLGRQLVPAAFSSRCRICLADRRAN